MLLAGCAARRTIALVGDSTTFGTPPPQEGIQSPYNPGRSLEALLAIDSGAWANAKVVNLGVGASTTAYWLASPPTGCGSLFAKFDVVKTACDLGTPWIKATSKAAGNPDLVVVDLGLNDYLITKDPKETVDRLEAIRAALEPVPVVFFPPLAPPDGPRNDWPMQVRKAMEERGLFTGEYPPYLPTFDRLHPTDGGYAGKAGLWLDAIRRVP
jgi:lysophospholipase L1-like esterase